MGRNPGATVGALLGRVRHRCVRARRDAQRAVTGPQPNGSRGGVPAVREWSAPQRCDVPGTRPPASRPSRHTAATPAPIGRGGLARSWSIRRIPRHTPPAAPPGRRRVARTWSIRRIPRHTPSWPATLASGSVPHGPSDQGWYQNGLPRTPRGGEWVGALLGRVRQRCVNSGSGCTTLGHRPATILNARNAPRPPAPRR